MRHFTDTGYNIDIESEEFYEGYKEPVTFRKVWNVISAILASLCAVALLIVFIPRIAGFNAYPFLPAEANAVLSAIYTWIITPPWMYLVIFLVVILVFAAFLPDIVIKSRYRLREKQLEEREEADETVE